MSTLRRLYLRYWALVPVLFAIAAFIVTHPWSTYDPYYSFDTPSYLQAWTRLRAGSIDCFRTPVYPVFTGLTLEIFPHPAGTAIIVGVQLALFLISAYALARICRDFLKMPRWMAIAAALPYCCFRAFLPYHIFITTDSPAASLFIIFTLCFLRSLSKPDLDRYVFAGVFAAMLVLLRPGFLYISIALLMLAILVWTVSRRKAFGCILAAMICVTATGAYAAVYHHRTGIWAISCVGDINAVIMNSHVEFDDRGASLPTHSHFIRVSKGMDPEEERACWDELTERAAVDPQFLQDELQLVQSANPDIAWRRTIHAAPDNLRHPVAGSPLTYWFFPVVALLYGCALVVDIRNRRKDEYIARAFIWLLVCGQFAVVVLRAPDDYPRLLMPALPFIPAMCLDMVCMAVNRVASLRHRGSCGSRAEDADCGRP